MGTLSLEKQIPTSPCTSTTAGVSDHMSHWLTITPCLGENRQITPGLGGNALSGWKETLVWAANMSDVAKNLGKVIFSTSLLTATSKCVVLLSIYVSYALITLKT